MTTHIRALNDAELASIAGGMTLLTSSIVLPNIPRASQLLTPGQIASLLSVPFVPPPPHG